MQLDVGMAYISARAKTHSHTTPNFIRWLMYETTKEGTQEMGQTTPNTTNHIGSRSSSSGRRVVWKMPPWASCSHLIRYLVRFVESVGQFTCPWTGRCIRNWSSVCRKNAFGNSFAGKTSETNNPSSFQREKRPSRTYGRQCAMQVCTVPLKLSYVLDMPWLGVPLASSSGEDFGEDQRCHGLPLGSCSKNPNGQGFCVWEYQYCGLIRLLPSNGHENRFKRCCLQRCCINPDLFLQQVTAPVQKANKFWVLQACGAFFLLSLSRLSRRWAQGAAVWG